MEELRRTQELRVDEFSVQKLRGRVMIRYSSTSQIQELQERVNCMNDVGKFHDFESNYGGIFSHVPSQPAVVPSPCGMLSRDQSLRPDTWNLLGTSRNVFESIHTNRFIIDTLSRNSSLHENKCHRCNPNASKRIGSSTPMPMTAGRPSTINSFLPAEIPQNSLAAQQRLQISELQFDKFPSLSSFSCCWKIKFKTQARSCSDFSLGSCVMDQRSGDGRCSG